MTGAPAPEFSVPVDTRHLPGTPVRLTADEQERRALAKRFALTSLDRLEAEASLSQDGDGILVQGSLSADIVQQCVVSAEDLPTTIAATFRLLYLPADRFEAMLDASEADEDGIELSADDCDMLPMEGSSIDLGEAVAQTLALEIDPYPEGPNAERVRREMDLSEPDDSGPFAALKALKKD